MPVDTVSIGALAEFGFAAPASSLFNSTLFKPDSVSLDVAAFIVFVLPEAIFAAT